MVIITLYGSAKHTHDYITPLERVVDIHHTYWIISLSYLNVQRGSELTDHGEALVVDVAAHLEMLLQGYRSIVSLVKLCA